MEEATADIKDISYGTLLFRHIDRILNLSNRDFADDDMKLFTFGWSVRLLRKAIANEIIDDEFIEEEAKIKKDGRTYAEKFEAKEELFSICLNLLARKGYLFDKNLDGDYEN